MAAYQPVVQVCCTADMINSRLVRKPVCRKSASYQSVSWYRISWCSWMSTSRRQASVLFSMILWTRHYEWRWLLRWRTAGCQFRGSYWKRWNWEMQILNKVLRRNALLSTFIKRPIIDFKTSGADRKTRKFVSVTAVYMEHWHYKIIWSYHSGDNDDCHLLKCEALILVAIYRRSDKSAASVFRTGGW
jgi:hypothetical protein